MSEFWDQHILPTLREYIRIPCKSPSFDPNWEQNGHIDLALQLVLNWVETHKPSGAQVRVERLENRTPLILIEVPGSNPELNARTVLMYGHLDKQPEMSGWRKDLGPWKDVYLDGKLYGRGGGDDGYAIFASLGVLKLLQSQGLPHSRTVILIEFSEESGSPDLPFYVDHCAESIGSPELVICLDSGAGNYDQLWCTTSLRGVLAGTLRVNVLREGVHSGDGSGVVASSFRIARQLLSRFENESTGEILLPELQSPIPAERIEQAKRCAEVLGAEVHNKFSFVLGMQPVASSNTELILNRTWRPALSVIGQEGLPNLLDGGNVLRPYTTLKLSMRLPPTLDAKVAKAALQKCLSANPPYGAQIEVSFEKQATGWNAPTLAPWLVEALNESSKNSFGKTVMYTGEGGTIPFMFMLGEKFPQAQFVVTGVLGPHSNAHGPNEFLHVPYAKKVSSCVAEILWRHGKQKNNLK